MKKADGSPQDRRLECTFEVIRVLAEHEAIEAALPPLLKAIHATLPLASAILIDSRDGRLRKLVWHAEKAEPGRLLRAEANAWATYTFYAGPVPERSREVETQRFAIDLATPAATLRAIDQRGLKNFITLPLTIERGVIFGAFQLEGAHLIEEADVAFVSALVRLLSLAIDRWHAVRRTQPHASAR